MSSSFVISPAVFIKNSVVDKGVWLQTTMIDGKMFAAMLKSDYNVFKLTVGGSKFATHGRGAMSHTNIFEQLKGLRDDAVRQMLGDDSDMKEKMRRAKRDKRLMADIMKLPDTIAINAPQVGSVQGRPMVVKSGMPSEHLMIEMSVGNMDYLRDAVLSQIATGTCRRTHARFAREAGDRVSVESRGVTFSHAKRKYRALRTDGDGKRKCKYFDSEVDATAFVEGGVVDDDGDGDGDDDREGDESEAERGLDNE